jgi:excisionase family DNA binding protein
MLDVQKEFVSSADAAKFLGIKQMSIHALIRDGRLPAVMVAYRWLIQRDQLEEFAKTYVPKQGRPRQKRQYTKRSPKWSKEQ